MRPAGLRTLVPLALGALAAASAAAPPVRALPPIRHVFVLVLENEPYAASFGPGSPAPYLARTLPAAGALLRNYYGIGHESLGNYVAMISGQAPNVETQNNCPTYSEFRLSAPGLDPDGQALGSGCVYPPIVRTLPDQLEAAGFTWKAYMEDMGNDPARERATCGHVALGAADPTGAPRRGDQYAAKHDPFVYFHSLIDDSARCDAHVVSLERLADDLGSLATTPNYVFITPNQCNDGHDARCVDGRRGGLAAINAFLEEWVPRIERSAAFGRDGMLIVLFDEADGSDSGACCGERPLPGARLAPGISGPGGGRVGAVVLSPFVRPGTVTDVSYNHYSLLKTVEAIFGLPPLGYAGRADLAAFGADVFTAAARRPPAR
ncbi:MAG TPA: alkaline phosphatase family protein [Steroidobacteraceae bacterium]|nr:alkaline phosphatase family protein [Steroidobacteraceae bacterium]